MTVSFRFERNGISGSIYFWKCLCLSTTQILNRFCGIFYIFVFKLTIFNALYLRNSRKVVCDKLMGNCIVSNLGVGGSPKLLNMYAYFCNFLFANLSGIVRISGILLYGHCNSLYFLGKSLRRRGGGHGYEYDEK